MSSLKKVTVKIISGFVDNDEGGNPAGVVFNADNFSNTEKLKIASKVGLSETAFISRSSVADFKLDFFTPSRQIAHCGHATIAAFSYMLQTGMLKKAISSKETIDGIRKIIMRDENAFMEHVVPAYNSVEEDLDKILLSLQLQREALIHDAQPSIINTGNSFLIIGLKQKQQLKNLQPDLNLIAEVSEKYGLIGYYVFTIETEMPGRDATSRMFGPFYGIPEESATGMAAGPLACYLFEKMQFKKEKFLIEQGWFMNKPSPSLIIVDLVIKDNSITSLMAGGKGKSIRSIEIEI